MKNSFKTVPLQKNKETNEKPHFPECTQREKAIGNILNFLKKGPICACLIATLLFLSVSSICPISAHAEGDQSAGTIYPPGKTEQVPYLTDYLNSLIPEGKKIQLDLFVMSQCPYAVKAERVIVPFALEHPELIEFNLYYIGNQTKEGKLESLHGESEVEENIRQLAIKSLYPDLFYDYLLLRGEDYYSENWEKAADELGLETVRIAELASADETRRLYLQNIEQCQRKSIVASPTLLVENEPFSGVITAEASSADRSGNTRGCCTCVKNGARLVIPTSDSKVCDKKCGWPNRTMFFSSTVVCCPGATDSANRVMDICAMTQDCCIPTTNVYNEKPYCIPRGQKCCYGAEGNFCSDNPFLPEKCCYGFKGVQPYCIPEGFTCCPTAIGPKYCKSDEVCIECKAKHILKDPYYTCAPKGATRCPD